MAIATATTTKIGCGFARRLYPIIANPLNGKAGSGIKIKKIAGLLALFKKPTKFTSN